MATTAVVAIDSAEQGLHVPPGAAHRFRNESDADVHFLVVSAPRSHGDREELRDEAQGDIR